MALLSLIQVFFDLSYWEAFFAMAALMSLVAIYSAISGLMGVVLSDAIQFITAMIGWSYPVDLGMLFTIFTSVHTHKT